MNPPVYRYRQPEVSMQGHSMPGPVGPLYLVSGHVPYKPPKREPGGRRMTDGEPVETTPLTATTFDIVDAGPARSGLMSKHGHWVVLRAFRVLRARATESRDKDYYQYWVAVRCDCGKESLFDVPRWKRYASVCCRKCAIALNAKTCYGVGQNPSAGSYLTIPQASTR